jgi:ketopantoate hydroxymethyltransferase
MEIPTPPSSNNANGDYRLLTILRQNMSVSYKELVNTAVNTLHQLKTTHYTKFITMNNIPIYRHIGYDDETIPKVSHIKFHGKTTNNALSWRNHTEQVEH